MNYAQCKVGVECSGGETRGPQQRVLREQRSCQQQALRYQHGMETRQHNGQQNPVKQGITIVGYVTKCEVGLHVQVAASW